jgi:MFS family permease
MTGQDAAEPVRRAASVRRLLHDWRWLPPETTPDAAVLIAARGVRAFGDGFVSVLLPVYLLSLGLDGFQIGGVATATLLGSAALTLAVGLIAHRFKVRRLLVGAALLMAATGASFALVHAFWPLLVVAFVGTLNPSSGDVSVFLPLEQSVLPQTVSARERTALFARYSLIGSLLAAGGALCAGLPELLARYGGLTSTQALQGMFLLYGLLGLISLVLYNQLSPRLEETRQAHAPLRESRRMVYTFAALFSLDSLGGGFVVQSLLALWLFERFDLSIATAGTIFFWTGVCSAGSYLVAARLAQRIGLVNTMVFTHLPSNVLLLLVPFMPNLPLAILLLLARSALSQMDVPTRNSYVMAVVPPAERPAAASVTSVPRSLATAASPLLSGYLLGLSSFGWPLVIGGVLKGIYDLLLLAMFARVKPPEETSSPTP